MIRPDVAHFRQLLCEQGTEITYDEAEPLYDSLCKILDLSKRASQLKLGETLETAIETGVMTESEAEQVRELILYSKQL